MKKSFTWGGVAVALLALTATAVMVPAAHAANNNKYSFTARGIITDFDEGNKTFKMDVTKVDGKPTAKNDLEGKNVEFTIGSPIKVVKVVNGKDKPGTYHNLAIGQEVGVKGVGKNDDTNPVSFIRIEDRSFTVVGLLKSLDHDAKTMTLLVYSSTYKPNAYKKGTEINMTYTDDSTFRNKDGAITFDTVNANDERIQVKGTIMNNNTWQVNTLFENYKGK